LTHACIKHEVQVAPPPAPSQPQANPEERVTLVLSVGGVRGLAHIGAIDALKRKGIKIHSVFGNSMGAVIGGLYATAPNSDLATRYRELIAAYQSKSEQDTPVYRKVAIWLKLSDVEFDNKRFETVMSDYFGRVKIENLPVKFATSYKIRQGNSIRDEGRVSGDLAEAIARSTNNPFIFKSGQLDYIDPGIDRMSAIPVEDACRTFQTERIVAVNVTGDSTYYSRQMTCKVTEVKLNIPDFRPEEELSGSGRNFEWLYRVGFDGMTDALGKLGQK
jgi:predicted acylesterase/phospholipase RssA